MFLHSLDALFRSSKIWKAIGIALCFWIAGVIVFAGMAAYDDGMELYRWTMLTLLLVGVPTMFAALAYAGSLIGPKERKWALMLVIFVSAVVGAITVFEAHETGSRKERVLKERIEVPHLNPERRSECKKECAGDPNPYCQVVCEGRMQ